MRTYPKRVIGGIVGLLLAAVTLTACTSSHKTSSTSANKVEAAAQAADSQSLLVAQPVPHYDWSQIRQTLIELEGAQAKTIQTTSFFFQQGMDHPYLICNSIGFPVSATTQLTNPQQIVHDGYTNGGASVPIPQMDPNGIYSGNSAGTYVLCVMPNGQVEAQYAEPFVHTASGPAAWDKTTGTIVFTGNPTGGFTAGK